MDAMAQDSQDCRGCCCGGRGCQPPSWPLLLLPLELLLLLLLAPSCHEESLAGGVGHARLAPLVDSIKGSAAAAACVKSIE